MTAFEARRQTPEFRQLLKKLEKQDRKANSRITDAELDEEVQAFDAANEWYGAGEFGRTDE